MFSVDQSDLSRRQSEGFMDFGGFLSAVGNAPVNSRALGGATELPSNSEIRVSDVRASAFDKSLVGQACDACTRLFFSFERFFSMTGT